MTGKWIATSPVGAPRNDVYALDCFATLAMTGGDFVFCNDDVRKIAASSAAMTGEICVAMTWYL